MAAETTDEQFRTEVRNWLKAHLPPDMVQRARTDVHPSKADVLGVTAVLSRVGWSVPHWSVEDGGPGWSAQRCLILEEELQLAGGAQNNIQGVSLAGPVIAAFGTPEQKAQHLPGIREGRVFWAQGFSEPNSGSDLASLRTRAVRHGDKYVVDGQKIWTSQAMYGDWLFCLVRTDPAAKPQAGITFLLIDMKSPGITVRPIPSIDEGESLCEVFLESVEVPVANRVGEEGKGWTYAKYLLEKERVQTAEVPRNKLYLARLKAQAASARRDGRPLTEDPVFALNLAQAEIDVLALEAAVALALDTQDRSALTPSALKIVGCELMQRQLGLQVEALGPYGALWYPHSGHGADGEPPPGPADAPGVIAEFLFRRAATIYGGSSEIQKNIIAKLLFSGQDGTRATLTEDQTLLVDSASRFAQQRHKAREARPRKAMPTAGEAANEAAQAWRQLCETGFVALGLPEAQGGAGGSLHDLAAVSEALGAGAVDAPLVGLGVLPLQVLAALGLSDGQRIALVEPLLNGKRVTALAHEPSPHGAPLRARPDGAQWVLGGDACMVDGGAFADRYLVAAETEGRGPTLFVVDATAPGLHRRCGRTIDHRQVADLSLQNVVLPDSARLGAPGAAAPALARALDIARVMACADAVGAMGEAFRITRDYLAVRKQFGSTLSSFQALQHRVAEMYAELAVARAIVRRAVDALAGEGDASGDGGLSGQGVGPGDALQRRRFAAACAARVGRAATFVGSQSVQLHGGIGMTEEYVIGRYYKRLLAFTLGRGNPTSEARRFAAMNPH